MYSIYNDRLDAGEVLARSLEHYRGTDSVVIGLARGGMIVASVVADYLGAPLQTLAVRKIGDRRNPEVALGAVTETGEVWLEQNLIRESGSSDEYIRNETRKRLSEAQRLGAIYGGRPEEVRSRTAIIVDDGIATGATIMAAILSVRALGAREIVVAAPIGLDSEVAALAREVDEVVVPATPERFLAIGLFYRNFEQISDGDVIRVLRSSQRRVHSRAAEPVLA